MHMSKLLPPSLRPVYFNMRGIPFTKGYKKEFDEEYEKKSRDWMRYQSVPRLNYRIDSEIETEKGLAVKTWEREVEIAEILKEQKYSFEEPGVILNPYGLAPLCAYILFYTEEKCKVRFCVKGKSPEMDITDVVNKEDRWHRVPVYGLYADTENVVSLQLLDKENKQIAEKTIMIKTDPLPESLEDLVRIEKKTAPSAMKLILVAGKSTAYPAAFDEKGDIRYYMLYRPRGYGFFELANGRFIMMERQTLLPTKMIPHSTQMYEIDYLGRVYRTYYVPNGIHHDVCEMTPGGNLLVVSNSQCGHVEDCIAEVNRQNGRIEKFLDLRDVLYTAYRDRTNWIHINSLDYNAKTNDVIFSARNLHSIFSINWKTNKLNWILGETNFWCRTPWAHKLLKVPSNMPWHFQQHSVKIIRRDLDGRRDTQHLIVFDNHWHLRRRISAFDNDDKSYVTIYEINEKAGTAKILKRFAGIKSKITSNGVLKYDQKRLFYMAGYLAYPEENDDRGGMIYEYDYDTGREVNRYNMRHFFFRAFEMTPNLNDLASAMDLQGEPCVGYLQPFEEMQEIIGIPKEMVESAPLECQEERVRLQIEDGNLWVKSRDHLVTQVFLVGEKRCYVKDFRKPEREQDLAAEMEYFLSIPLYNVKKGEYTVVVEFKGKTYNTGKTIRLYGNLQ